MLKRNIVVFCLLVFIVGCAPKTYYDRIDLVTQMHNAGKDSWGKSILLEKKITIYANGLPIKKSKWQQAISAPMLSHARMNGFETGNGAIIVGDTVFQFNNDSLKDVKCEVNPLLLMTHSIYFLNPDTTKQKLMQIGCDFDNSYIAEWKERKVYVMGTVEENLSKTQFWIDYDNMFLVRAIIVNGKEIKEYRFDKFKQKEGIWIAEKMITIKDGQKTMKQEILDVQFPKNTVDSLFDVEKFSETHW